MKKIITLAIFAMIVSLAAPVFAQTDLTGKVVKLEGGSTLYYITEAGELYVFPNEKTYKTWFNDFSGVLTVTQEELSPYMPPVGNVHYRPGILLVKIQTDPKVYAVSTNGILRWVKTEKLAKRFYGEDWNKIIEDIPAGFFVNYQIGDDINDDDDFDTDQEVEDSDTIDGDHHRRGKENDNRGKKFERAKKAHTEIRGKTRVCHNVANNPHTISISNAALPAHLAHGDTIGPCEGDDDDDNDDITAPVISNINSATATTTAVINWTTNEKSTSKVTFSQQPIANASSTSSVSSGSLVTAHSVNLTGLTASTTYYFIVESTDSSSNTATSTQHSFTTTIPVIDVTAPIISNIVATSTASTTATITWNTNELANGKVVYANESLTTASTTNMVSLNTLLALHTFNLTGLTASTTYYFIVNSADTIGNSATSTQQMFTTPL